MKKHNIGLVAHDACKKDLIDWCRFNANVLEDHDLYATGTTGKLISDIRREVDDIIDYPLSHITILNSGPLGGDQELGAMIARGELDILIFFADHLSMQPHDSDIKALSRLGGLYNIPMACNRSTADYLISSPLFNDEDYDLVRPEFTEYINRKL